MLPNTLLASAVNHTVLIELKNGDSYSGLLVKVDKFMNCQCRDVVCIAANSELVKRTPDLYIRGNAIKYLRLPPNVEEVARQKPADEQRGFGKGKGKKGRGEGAGPQRAGDGKGGGNYKREGGGKGGPATKVQRR